MAEFEGGAQVAVRDGKGTTEFVHGRIHMEKNVWGQCAVPSLVSNSQTLFTVTRFRLKVRDYLSAPDRFAL